MKSFFALALVSAALLPAAEEDFSKTVRAADFSAAGLAKLSPDELARLDALVRDYKSGALIAAKRDPSTLRSDAASAATTDFARAEVAAAETKKSEGGILAKAKALLPAGTTVEYSAIESRIVGDFKGWQGKSIFTLENGQRWQVANPGSYVTPALANPAVKITPAALGGFWMTIEGVSQRVKVVSLDAGR